jgi:hypothetical protein
VDRIIIAAADVVEAWDDHTLELNTAIRTLAEALEAALTAPAGRPSTAERVAVGAGAEVGAAR